MCGKNAVRNKEKLSDPIKRYPRKAAIIKDALIKNNVKTNISELRALISVFAHADPRIIRRLIKVLAIDIQSRRQHNRPEIKSMAAYAANLYEQYRAGVGKAISNTLAYNGQHEAMRALEMLSSPLEKYCKKYLPFGASSQTLKNKGGSAPFFRFF